jgi:hypothetical protein
LKLFQEWKEGRIKKNDGGGEFKYDVFYICKNFGNATVYSHRGKQFLKKKENRRWGLIGESSTKM